MNAEQIVKEAKARLAEIEAEATKLRALIAAAEGNTIAPLPAPNPLPFIPVMPQPYRYEPAVPWPLDRVTCGSVLSIEADPNVICTNGIRTDTNIVIGGLQRMDPNVRYIS